MLTQNDLRAEVQDNAVELCKKYDALLLQWATGVGKSLAAIKCIDRVFSKDIPTYILCEEIIHIKNWLDEFRKHDLYHLIQDGVVKIFCYDSLHKVMNTEANLVLDECHVAKAPLAWERLGTLKHRKVVMLSATVNKEIAALLYARYQHHKWTITMDEAQKAGLLPEAEYVIIYTDLKNDTNLRTVRTVIKKGTPSVSRDVDYPDYEALAALLKNNYELTVYFTEAEYYEYLEKKITIAYNTYRNARFEGNKRKWLQLTTQRKRFLAETKTPYAKKLLEVVSHHRLLCFTGSQKQCNELGGQNAVHSRNSRSAKIIEAFNNYEVDSLFVVNMMKSGQNLQGIQTGVLVQLDANELSFIQKSGRIFRSDYPVLYILVVRGTRDEVFLQTAISGVNTKNRRITTLEQVCQELTTQTELVE
jgi:superfamily II DNA or RNA helicase